MKKMEDKIVQKEDIDKYKPHKVIIDGKVYITKIDKKTNKPVYKKQYSVSVDGVPKRGTTKGWFSSITKVNQEVEHMRYEMRTGIASTQKKAKHLFSDVVTELYEKRIEQCKVQNDSFETTDAYLSNNKKYVLNDEMEYPNFKNRYLEDITVREIKELKHNINSYAIENGLSTLTVGHIFTNIDRTLKYSAECAYIEDSIANSVKVVAKGAKCRKRITIENYLLKNEYDEFMEVFNKEFKFTKNETEEETEYRMRLYKVFIETAFKLGFRKGEGFSMIWNCYQNEEINITTTLNTKGVKKHLKYINKRVIDPKTFSSIRTMRTPSSIRIALDEWKEYCQSLGMDVSDNQFIFREYNGEPFNPSTFARRFERIVEESGIEDKYNKHLYPHGFRHSCASFLIQQLREKDNEISLREIYILIGKYLGHSSDVMVREVYGHLYPDSDKSILSQLLDEI